MTNQVTVKKSSGESQDFSEEKLYHSLKNSGASEKDISEIISEIRKDLYEGITTKSIYRRAFRMLRRKVHATAGRYSLKNAIMELGPTGYLTSANWWKGWVTGGYDTATISVNYLPFESLSFQIYPNPNSGELLVRVISNEKINAHFRIVDLQGRIMAEFPEYQLIQGINPGDFKLPDNLVSGIYILEAITDHGSKREKLILRK